MHQAILTALVVVSTLLIVLVAIQPTQTNASSSLNGGTEGLFSKPKARLYHTCVTPRSF
jgi:preprotein translocase subunit SecG